MNRPDHFELAQPLRRFKPYPAYKDSGVEWLGRIPTHWATKSLKRIFRVANGSTPASGEPSYWDGDIPWVTPEDLGRLSGAVIQETQRTITEVGYRSCGTTLVPSGSLLLSTRAPIGHLGIAGMDACTNQGCRSLVFRNNSSRKFFYYELLAARPELESLGQGSTFKELSKDALENVALAEPDLREQGAIAAFLDRETARIDDLVAKKERLIDLLQESRTALITGAVTRGIDESVRMKDSGVQWLGKIPEHWRMSRLKEMVPAITVGIVVTPAKYYVDAGVPCLRSLNIAQGRVDMKDLVFISSSANELHEKSKIFAGDVLIVRTGKAGAAVVVPQDLDGANCIDLLIIRRSDQIDSRFLYYFINSPATSGQVEAHSVGAIQEHYNTSTLRELHVPVLPLEEQQRIADFLDQQTKRIDSFIAKVRDGIERLRELRTALISAAVTGKIDVREDTQ